MKPIASGITEVDNLQGEVVDFSISDARWVMRSMADLYSNRELAVIREYSTNAYDASVEYANSKGVDPAPIHVTLPSRLNPYFTVQDFGIGMSESELKEIYTQFGNSTKRDSNDYNGMLGFGCKSAVAYTNSFTVTSVKDGKKTVAVINRREDFSITLKVVVPSAATSEPNGTTVQVPVHNAAEFAAKAQDFYCFWKAGTVLVNGKEPNKAIGEKIHDGLFYTKDSQNSYVVMGNVPYRIENPSRLFKKVSAVPFVAYVENGAVEFVPSREALKYSNHTKTNLHKVIDNFEEKAIKNAKDEIVNAPDHATALKNWNKWTNVLGNSTIGDLVYKGDPLVVNVEVDYKMVDSPWGGSKHKAHSPATRYDSRSNYNSINKITTINTFQALDGLIFLGGPVSAGTEARRRAKDWAKLKGIDARFYWFLSQDKFESVWIDSARVVQWEQVKKDVPPPPRAKGTANGYGRKAGTFDLLTQTKRHFEQDVPSGNLYYISVQDLNMHTQGSVKRMMTHFSITESVVIVPGNREAKFLRNYPKAVRLLDHLATMVKFDGPSLVPEEYKKYCATVKNYSRHFAILPEDRIDDPDIKEYIRLSKKYNRGAIDPLDEYHKHARLAAMIGMRNKFTIWEDQSWRSVNPLTDKYPLVDNNASNINHVVFYMNSVYQARKSGTNI